MSNINKFLELFSQFDLVVKKSGKQVNYIYEEQAVYSPTVSELKRSIKRLEREYSAAKKAFKAGKICREELFDYEWRLHELREELKKIQGNDPF